MAYTVITNVSESDFQEIHNYLNIALAHFEKVYKRNLQPRRFVIADFWKYKYNNNVLELDATRKINDCLACLEVDISKVFNIVKDCWLDKSDLYFELSRALFWSCHKRNYSYKLNENNKFRWLLHGRPPSYYRPSKFEFDVDDI